LVLSAAASASAPAPAANPSERDLEAFFDSYLAAQMATQHVAGAAVAVVEGDRVLLTKGYGQADLAQRTPVDPERTTFLLGSLSKVFTWTAVMQLVERGQLDLDADVNRYLDFRLPETFPQPITLRHLMDHTSGFEDRKFGQLSPGPAPEVSLGNWLKGNLPARILPPGRFSAYGNYNAALAGYVVERVSGLPFDDYVDQRLLAPLGMTHTTSRQPPPEPLAARRSQLYRFTGGEYRPQPQLSRAALDPAPAGAFQASAADVARFMIAHVNGGAVGAGRILEPATVERMHGRSFGHDPRVNGFAHGFWELGTNGEAIIGHAGSHFVGNSLLLLFPARRLGVFVVTNSEGGNAFVGSNYFTFLRAFVDRFFPAPAPPVAPTSTSGAAERAERFTGSYHLTMGRSESGPEKLFALMAVGMEQDGDGIAVLLPSGRERFVEVEPLLFRQVNGDARIVFHEEDGQVVQAFYGPAPLTALVKNRWFEAPAFQLSLLAGSVLLFLSFLVAAPVTFLLRRRRPGRAPAAPSTIAAVLCAGVTCALGISLVLGVTASILDMVGLYLGRLPLWALVRPGSVLVACLACATFAFAVVAWVKRRGALLGRIYFSFVAVAGVAFVWFLSFWNLLGNGFRAG
jgi:CubicO group peptidase (beta-lactamase class C family)